MLRFQNVSKAYKKKQVLNQVNFYVGAGERVAVVGQNGSGKSTILSLAMGLNVADGGCVHVLGRAMPQEKIQAHRRLAMVFDTPQPLGVLTLREHLSFVCSVLAANKTEFAKNVAHVAQILQVDFLDAKTTDLSLGTLQKGHLLLAFARKPDLILLDEPTTGLDDAGQHALGALLDWQKQGGRSVLLTSHDAEFVKRNVDYCLHLNAGDVARKESTCWQN